MLDPALFCYEWLVTFDQEIKYIWAKGWTLSTWIFAVNRYASLIFAVGKIWPTTNITSCRATLRILETLNLLQYVVAARIRVFAISNRNGWLFLVVFVLNVVPVATNMFSDVAAPVEYFKDLECTSVLNVSEEVELGLSFSTRGSVILADVIVLAVTWAKAIGTFRQASRLNVKVPLSEILIRDGTLFFIVLLGVNTFALLANDLPNIPEVLPIFGVSLVALFVPSLICLV
ncbi:hypothetical protein BC835DRAFT_1459262 [Cytidiella melzeri]|nr:hypothetical protein BC835DRAFT_1459262 [Cytidiella melzeri]